jgi:hypothetical protein
MERDPNAKRGPISIKDYVNPDDKSLKKPSNKKKKANKKASLRPSDEIVDNAMEFAKDQPKFVKSMNKDANSKSRDKFKKPGKNS